MAYLAHLPLPYHFKSYQDGIPYCSTTGYDGGSFLEYPNRAGWPQAIPGPESTSFLEREVNDPSDDEKLEDFLQTWLFFGLLHELLGARFDESRYVFKDALPAMVHTKTLQSDIGAWCREAEHVSPEEGARIYSHLQKCLLLASSAMNVTISPVHTGFNRAVRQSIALLCDTIARLVEESLPQPDGCKIPTGWTVFYHDQQLMSTMKNNGWCHSEAVKIKDESSASQYFMERMVKPNLGRDHKTCGQDQCQYLTTDEKTYRTRHVDDDCKCKDISTSLGSLASILDHGALPLLSLRQTENSELNVTVEASDSVKAFVALSHVWADGLGNSKANSLPTCQLRRLANLLQRLHGYLPWNSEMPERRELLLWCDTLCVPVKDSSNQEQNRLRDLAMRRMRDVYQQSSYVLVLDQTFESYNVNEIGLMEAAFRIKTSPWAQRLWTYQEAVLPKNLLFQFSDKVIDIRDIWKYHLDLKKGNVLLTSMAFDIVPWCGMIRQPFHAEEGKTLSFSIVISSLRGRYVSYPLDEPQCLATIFGTDTTKMQQAPEEQRMGEFWKALSKTPTGIDRALVLNDFARLETPGLRWAPATLLNDLSISQSIWNITTDAGDKKGQLTDTGLLVDLAAFRTNRAHRITDVALSQARTRLEVVGTMHLRDMEGRWYDVHLEAIHGDTSLDDIFESISSGDDKMIVLVKEQLGDSDNDFSHQAGLLTKPVETASEPPVLRSLALVTMSSMQHGQQSLWALAFDMATGLRDGGYLTQAQSQLQTTEDGNTTSQTLAASTEFIDILLSGLLQLASVACAQEPALPQLIESMGRKPPEQFFAFLILRMLLGQYLVVPEKFEAGRMWCVD